MVNNLDKAYNIWIDVDNKCLAQFSKSEFLRKLVRDGNQDAVNSVIASLGNCVEVPMDSEKFNFVKEQLEIVLEFFDDIPENLTSISDFIGNCKGTGIVETNSLQPNSSKALDLTEELEDRVKEVISIVQPYALNVVPIFSIKESKIGVEVITSTLIHKVDLVSDEAVIVPSFYENDDDLELSDNPFHIKVKKLLNRKNNKLTYPMLLTDSSFELQNKYIKKVGRGLRLEYEDFVMPIKRV